MDFRLFGKDFNVDAKTFKQASSGFAGITALTDSYANANVLEEQGVFAMHNYSQRAMLIKSNGYRTRARQAMDYISSGVKLVGTPLLVLKDTVTRANAQAESYIRAGNQAQINSANKAAAARGVGRASLIKNVFDIGIAEL